MSNYLLRIMCSDTNAVLKLIRNLCFVLFETKFKMWRYEYCCFLTWKDKMLEMVKRDKAGDLTGYMRRGKVAVSHNVMKHFIPVFFWHCTSYDIINPVLCESKSQWKIQNCITSLQTNASTICTFQAFCSQMTSQANLRSILFLMNMFSLVCCCLQCVLLLCSFVIKGFSFTALCWTLSCNRGIN